MEEDIVGQIEARYPDCTLDHLDIDGDMIDIHLTSDIKSGLCPTCGKITASTQSRYVKKFADLPVSDRFTTVHLTLRQLRCREHGELVLFAARHAFLSDPRAKKTDRLVSEILSIASKNTVRGSVEVCAHKHIKCDKNTVSRLLKENKLLKRDVHA